MYKGKTSLQSSFCLTISNFLENAEVFCVYVKGILSIWRVKKRVNKHLKYHWKLRNLSFYVQSYKRKSDIPICHLSMGGNSKSIGIAIVKKIPNPVSNF